VRFAGAFVPIDKPDKPAVRAVFDRRNDGPPDEYAEVFAPAQVLRPVNVADPAPVKIDGVRVGALDPADKHSPDHQDVMRLLAWLHSQGRRSAPVSATLEGFPNGGVNVSLRWEVDEGGVPVFEAPQGGRGCGSGAALVLLALVALVLGLVT
jgi:hypothetical protein